LGVAPETILAAGEAFRFPQNHLVAVKTWAFSKSLAALARDASDIAVGPDHHVFVLSDESGTLTRLEDRLKNDETEAHENACWKLPPEIAHPEGLVIDGDSHPWIAS